VHPAVIDQYTSGELVATFRRAMRSARRRPVRGLRQPESVTLRWLEALPALPALPERAAAATTAGKRG
jgi:hypothetical protein